MTFPKAPKSLAAFAAWATLFCGAALAQQAVGLDGRTYMLPPGVEPVLGSAPPAPGAGGDPVNGIEFRWPDGRRATLALERPEDPLADLPPPSAVGAYDAHGVAPVSESWAAASAGRAGPGQAEAARVARSYVVRTRNPSYPLARILCEGRGQGARCRLNTRVGASSVLTADLPSTQPEAVAPAVSGLVGILSDP